MKMYYITEDRLTLEFPEDKKKECVSKIIDYLHYSDSMSYYFLFGYREGNVNIDKYKTKYPALAKDHGFIKIRKEDTNNTDLIIDLLFEYQIASLYMNSLSDLDEKNDFVSIRDSNLFTFAGYIIVELREDYITIKKGDNMPDWDLEKMGVSEDMVY